MAQCTSCARPNPIIHTASVRPHQVAPWGAGEQHRLSDLQIRDRDGERERETGIDRETLREIQIQIGTGIGIEIERPKGDASF